MSLLTQQGGRPLLAILLARITLSVLGNLRKFFAVRKKIVREKKKKREKIRLKFLRGCTIQKTLKVQIYLGSLYPDRLCTQGAGMLK
jgi:hypothetical protein